MKILTKATGEHMYQLGLVLIGMAAATFGMFDNSFHYSMIGAGLCQFFSGLIIIHKLTNKEVKEQ